MDVDAKFKVAIVGGGIGGASAAYFLRSLFKQQVEITIFEKSGEIGGRIKSVDFWGHCCEAGALAVHSSNQYMMDFAKQFDLRLINLSKADQRTVVLDNNSQEVFSSLEGCTVMAFGVTAMRYGFGLLRFRSYIKSILKDFIRIYQLQDEGYCFTTPARLLAAMRPEFVEMTSHTYDDWLKTEIRLNANVRDDLANGLMHFHYCQGLNSHAFAGLYSLTAVIPTIYCVEKGNQQVPQKVIQKVLTGNSKTENQTIIHANVTKVEHVNQSHKYKLTYEDTKTGETSSQEYDYVILAYPLNQTSNLQYLGHEPIPSTTFVEMDRILYYGRLRRNANSLRPEWCEKKQWITVLQSKTETPNTNVPWGMMHIPAQPTQPYTSKMIWLAHTDPQLISNPARRMQELYFEKAPNNSTESDTHFIVNHWYACPIYKKTNDPNQDLGNFVIAPGFFYLNALENAASSMEISAIAGRNVALLVAHSRNTLFGQQNSMSEVVNVQMDKFEFPTEPSKEAV